MASSVINNLNPFQYLSESCLTGHGIQERVKKVFSFAMEHGKKLLAVSFSLALYVVYKVGVISGGIILIGLGSVSFIFCKIYLNSLKKERDFLNREYAAQLVDRRKAQLATRQSFLIDRLNFFRDSNSSEAALEELIPPPCLGTTFSEAI